MASSKPSKRVKIKVNLSSIRQKDLVNELKRRGVLTQNEASSLRYSESLSDLYAQDNDQHYDKRLDKSAMDEARARIMRGDFAEALIQAERAHPDLTGLVHLSQRGA